MWWGTQQTDKNLLYRNRLADLRKFSYFLFLLGGRYQFCEIPTFYGPTSPEQYKTCNNFSCQGCDHPKYNITNGAECETALVFQDSKTCNILFCSTGALTVASSCNYLTWDTNIWKDYPKAYCTKYYGQWKFCSAHFLVFFLQATILRNPLMKIVCSMGKCLFLFFWYFFHF